MFQSRPLALLLVFVLLISPLARADIIPRGMKRVQSEVIITLGSLADQAWTAHIVKKGETLSSIARDRLGSAARSIEIARANPDVIPRRLRIGKRLELPPRKSFEMRDGKKVKLTPWRVYWWFDAGFRERGPVLVAPGEIVAAPHYSAVVIAIPHERKEALESAIKSKVHGAWGKVADIAKSEAIRVRRTVKQWSPTKVVKTTVKIGMIAKGKIAVTTSEKRFNGEGKEVAAGTTHRAPLLAASAVGLLFLCGLYFRRRRPNAHPVDAERQ